MPYFGGLDWGGAGHAVCIVDATGTVLLSLEMAGAIWFLHRHNGIFAGSGGWELPAALIAGLMCLSLASAGEFSYDSWANGPDTPRRRSRSTRSRR